MQSLEIVILGTGAGSTSVYSKECSSSFVVLADNKPVLLVDAVSLLYRSRTYSIGDLTTVFNWTPSFYGSLRTGFWRHCLLLAACWGIAEQCLHLSQSQRSCRCATICILASAPLTPASHSHEEAPPWPDLVTSSQLSCLCSSLSSLPNEDCACMHTATSWGVC